MEWYKRKDGKISINKLNTANIDKLTKEAERLGWKVSKKDLVKFILNKTHKGGLKNGTVSEIITKIKENFSKFNSNGQTLSITSHKFNYGSDTPTYETVFNKYNELSEENKEICNEKLEWAIQKFNNNTNFYDISEDVRTANANDFVGSLHIAMKDM